MNGSNFCIWILLGFLLSGLGAAQEVSEAEDELVLVPKVFPVFKLPLEKGGVIFTSKIQSNVVSYLDRVEERVEVGFEVLKGTKKRLSLEMSDGGKVLEVHGEAISGWSIRNEGGKRYLDFIPKNLESRKLKAVVFLERVVKAVPGELEPTTFGAAGALGFQASYRLRDSEEVRLEVVEAKGMLSSKDESGLPVYTAMEKGKLILRLLKNLAHAGPVELAHPKLTGEIDVAGGAATFRFQAKAKVARVKDEAVFKILGGKVGLISGVKGNGYRVRLARNGYELVFDKVGEFVVDFEFAVGIRENEGWKTIQFLLPAGAVVPVDLRGLPDSIIFDPACPVMPLASGAGHGGFLPGNGQCHFGWKLAPEMGDEELVFTGTSLAEVSIGAGLVRQLTRVSLKALQGELKELKFQLGGQGEIIDIEGEAVLGWEVTADRFLKIQLSKAIEQEGRVTINSQIALEDLPVEVTPLRVTPVGAVRHSGHFIVFNQGSVNLEVLDTVGLTQLSAEQYPVEFGADQLVRQMFYYRFPASERSYRVAIDRIKPEVNVSQVLDYEFTSTDRVLRADLELEIREAEIREWLLKIPSDYSVVSVTGAEVVDYIVSDNLDGERDLKILFAEEILGRRLIRIHLEKNGGMEKPAWKLPVLRFPGSKMIYGEIGISAVAGYRVSPGKHIGLVEIPLARLLNRRSETQQAFRIRDEGWVGEMKIEKLERSLSADGFHLYSLKDGRAYVSVLINFFVIGAPVHEWRLKMPTGVENLEVIGSDVRDFKVDEGVLVVPLHRPIMGGYQLLLTYEQKVDGRVNLGEVQPLDVQDDRGYVQVVSPGELDISNVVSKGLVEKLDPTELPMEYRLMVHAPSKGIWEYQRRPFALSVGVRWLDRGETAVQLVEYGEIESRISRDGAIFTVSTFELRVRTGGLLALDTPEGVKIREVLVNGEQATMRDADGKRLVQLPVVVDVDEPLTVEVRSSCQGGKGESDLATPMIAGTTHLKTKWKVVPDAGVRLIPRASSGMSLTSLSDEVNGFDWIEKNGLWILATILLLWFVGGCLMRSMNMFSVFGLLIVVVAIVGAFWAATMGFDQNNDQSVHLEYVSPVTEAGAELRLLVSHAEDQDPMISVNQGLLLLGVLVMLFGAYSKKWRFPIVAIGAVAISWSLLERVQGAGWFFAFLGGMITLVWILRVGKCVRNWRKMLFPKLEDIEKEMRRKRGGYPGGGGMTPTLVLFFLFFVGGSKLEGNNLWIASDVISETWDIKDGRISGLLKMSITGKKGDRFFALKPQATLKKFRGEGVRVVAEDHGYVVAPKSEGSFEVELEYDMPIVEIEGGLPILSGRAAVKELSVVDENAEWTMKCPAAVKMEELAGGGSRVNFLLGQFGKEIVFIEPRQRDLKVEDQKYFAEVTNLYIPGPGVIDGVHWVKINPSQGQISKLKMDVPPGFTVSDVRSEIVGAWKFDLKNKRLTVELEPIQARGFELIVETQQALKKLPVEFVAQPLVIQGAEGVIGSLGIAIGGEAQLEKEIVREMSEMNLDDFPSELIPQSLRGGFSAVLQKAYRYRGQAGDVSLKIGPVTPEVRVFGKHRLSIGNERVLLAADLVVDIMKAGIFRLSFPLPEEFEVDSINGRAVNHWSEVEADGKKTVVMNLKGKTLGREEFSVVLTRASGLLPTNDWIVPRVSFLESKRETGQLLLVPGKGIRIQSGKRKDLSSIDPRSIGGNTSGSAAYKIIQKTWDLTVDVEQLSSSIAVEMLQDVKIREGRASHRADVRLFVDHASIAEIGLLLPILEKEEVDTVRVSGPEIRDIVKGDGRQWKVRFQRRVIGEIELRIEFEVRGTKEEIELVQFVGVRQQESYLALRPGARLDCDVTAHIGWNFVDWVAVPKELLQVDRREAPAHFLRTVKEGGTVRYRLKKHSVVSGTKIRVLSGDLTSVVSTQGVAVHQAVLNLEILQSSSLRLGLPEGSLLFGVLVNGESALVVKDQGVYRFAVNGGSGGRDAEVRFTYSNRYHRKGNAVDLEAFTIGEPLEDVTWRIYLPSGVALKDAEGDLDLSQIGKKTDMSLVAYRAEVRQLNEKRRNEARERLTIASNLLELGERTKAKKTLQRVYHEASLDRATNEDARVKLERLATEEAVLGLNTRLQRMYEGRTGSSENDGRRGDRARNAASVNPIFAGEMNFRRSDLNQVINRNEADLNRWMDEIAVKWTEHQRVAEPVTQLLDPVVPTNDVEYLFTRKLHVNGEQSLRVRFKLEDTQNSILSQGRLAVIGLVVIAGLILGYFSLFRRND